MGTPGFRLSDYNKLQGTYHPSDNIVQIRRDLFSKHISLENGSDKHIGVAITNYGAGATPNIRIVMKPQEVKHLAVNQPTDKDQFIWLIDPVTKRVVADSQIIDRQGNQFVIRRGINKWMTLVYHRPVYNAAH
jgi:hypothetical protein